MNDSVENDYVKFWFEEGIIHGYYKKDCIISLKAAKEIVGLRLKFQQGKTCKGLIYITHIKMVTADAKEYLAKEGYEGIEKAALISSSFFTTVIGNVFISINKPIRPTRLFRKKEDALEWLKQP
jgi:hypothetical protein